MAVTLMCIGWALGSIIGIIPMFWNNWETATECEFDEVLPAWYMAGIVTPLFSAVWLCMLILYAKIWREASKHAKQLRMSFSGLNECGGSGSDWKSIQVSERVDIKPTSKCSIYLIDPSVIILYNRLIIKSISYGNSL